MTELHMLCADGTDHECYGRIPVADPLRALTPDQREEIQQVLDAEDENPRRNDRVQCDLELTRAQCEANRIQLDQENLDEIQKKGTLTFPAEVQRKTCAACGCDS